MSRSVLVQAVCDSIRRAPRLVHRAAWICVVLSPLLLSCGSSSSMPGAQAPLVHAAVQDLPVDLDVVVRFDLRRIRDVLPQPLFELLLDLGLEYYGATLFQAEIEQTEVLWIGFRSLPGDSRSASGFEGDYVWVLEGKFPSETPRTWRDRFFPARDLGAGYLRYDAKQTTNRFQAGRVYEKVGERLVIASAAEVDAVEKVIERHHFARSVVPQERGAISFAANTRRLAQTLGERSPKIAAVLERALSATGHMNITQQSAELHSRISFDRHDDALVGQDALRIVIALLLSLESVDASDTDNALNNAGFHLQVVERDLVIRIEYQLPDLMAWLGFS